tara:strand:- start:2883 stop:4220 length:1338 start_codon:yes stop_codon:yes gene_type:complete
MKKPRLEGRLKQVSRSLGRAAFIPLAAAVSSLPFTSQAQAELRYRTAFPPGGNRAAKGVVVGNTLTLSPDEPNPDFDGDGNVGFGDFLQFARAFGTSSTDFNWDPQYDLDSDDIVAFSDFLHFARVYGNDVVVEDPEPPIEPPLLSEIPLQNIPQVDGTVNPRTLNLADYVDEADSYEIVETHGLVTSLEDSVLTYRPRSTFYSTEDDTAYVKVKARKDDLESNVETINVDIEMDERAMQIYSQATAQAKGRWFEVPEDIVYDGNARNPGNSMDPAEATGPAPTSEQLDWCIEGFEKQSQITSGFFPETPDTTMTSNPTDIYHENQRYPFTPPTGQAVAFWDNTIPSLGLTSTYNSGNRITAMVLNFRTEAGRRTHIHEILCHGVGLGDIYSNNIFDISATETIFHVDGSEGNSLVYNGVDYTAQGFTPQDQAVVTWYYDSLAEN